MSKSRKSAIVSLLSRLFGRGQAAIANPSSDTTESTPTVVEEIRVDGFDPEGEPVLKIWSDGTLWIHFEAMPPFFAEEEDREEEFEHFEATVQDALGVPVDRQDREVFVIRNPLPDTRERAKNWLEAYRSKAG